MLTLCIATMPAASESAGIVSDNALLTLMPLVTLTFSALYVAEPVVLVIGWLTRMQHPRNQRNSRTAKTRLYGWASADRIPNILSLRSASACLPLLHSTVAPNLRLWEMEPQHPTGVARDLHPRRHFHPCRLHLAPTLRSETHWSCTNPSILPIFGAAGERRQYSVRRSSKARGIISSITKSVEWCSVSPLCCNPGHAPVREVVWVEGYTTCCCCGHSVHGVVAVQRNFTIHGDWILPATERCVSRTMGLCDRPGTARRECLASTNDGHAEGFFALGICCLVSSRVSDVLFLRFPVSSTFPYQVLLAHLQRNCRWLDAYVSIRCTIGDLGELRWFNFYMVI